MSNETLRAHGDHSAAYTRQTAQAIADAMRVLATGARDYPAVAVPDVTVIRDVIEQLRCAVKGLPELLASLEKRLGTLIRDSDVCPKVDAGLGAERALLDALMLVRTILEVTDPVADALEQRLAGLRNVVGDLEPAGGDR